MDDVQVALNKFESEINEKFANDKEEILLLLNNVQRNLAEGLTINSNDIIEIKRIVCKKQDKYDQAQV